MNHSIHLKNPETRVNTNFIGGYIFVRDKEILRNRNRYLSEYAQQKEYREKDFGARKGLFIT